MATKKTATVPASHSGTVDYESRRLADYTHGDSRERGHVDTPLCMLTLLLLAIGVVMVLSASFARSYYNIDGATSGNPTYYFARQLFFAALGVACMFLLSRLPMGFYRRISRLLFFFSIALLAVVVFWGVVTNGAQRWIYFGPISIQPSEITKVALILYFADVASRSANKMHHLPFVLAHFILPLFIICAFLAVEPHLSAIIIMLALTLVMIFVGGGRLSWFVIGGGGGAVAVFLASKFFPYVRDRLTAWRDPFADAADTGYQVVQSLYAIGSGGLLGLGLGNSRQKYLYLPEEHNDYIFSIVCEELGYVGAILILALFALLIIRGFWVARHARDRYSLMVGTGISTLLALQVFLNVAVVTNLIPSTGISLPFFSYGGTALLLQMAEMGILLSISRDITEKR